MLTDPRTMRKIIDGEGIGRVTLDQICSLIDNFVKSEYTSKLIKELGFKSTYLAFKGEVKDYCGLEQFIEIARKMIKEGYITDLAVLGEEFLQDADKCKEATKTLNALFAHSTGCSD